jgi:hypothetical protein
MKLKIIDRMAVIQGAAFPSGNWGSFHGKKVVAMLSIRSVYVSWLFEMLFCGAVSSVYVYWKRK